MSAAGPPQGANFCGLRAAGRVDLHRGVGRRPRSQMRPSGLGFALLARPSSMGSEAASAASVGAHMSAAGPPQGANCSPSGGSEAASAASVGAYL
jgi:hypothetical protein